MVIECSKSVGLAWFLRKSLAGEALSAQAAVLLNQLTTTAAGAKAAGAWRDAALALMSMGQSALGLEFLQQALQLNRHFVLPHPPEATLRVLMLMYPGALSANTPLECLLDTMPLVIIQSYLPDDSAAVAALSVADLPDHDVLWMAVAESPESQAVLQALLWPLAHWPHPVVNAPQAMLKIARHCVAETLQGLEELYVPETEIVQRVSLSDPVSHRQWHYPLIVRPEGSQGGVGLAQITQPEEWQAYLVQRAEPAFYLAPYIDYRNVDGWFGKMRIALLDGCAWPCHYAFSSHWMVHYVSAGMYENPEKRALEQKWMQNFAQWSQAYAALWPEISRRLGLTYVLLDMAQLQDGRLLLFEADPAMVVHRMDSPTLFPYKEAPMRGLQEAVVRWLYRLAGQ